MAARLIVLAAVVAFVVVFPLMPAATPFFNKFRHWPMSENGTCGDDGPGTLTCPAGYQCYVGPIYNRPYFCFHERIDPNADPYEELERVRSSAMRETSKSCPRDGDVAQRLNTTEAALQQLVDEMRGLREAMGNGEKSLLDWALATAPIACIFLFTITVLLFHLKLRYSHTKTRRLLREATRETAARIENLAEACFLSTPSPPRNLEVRRQGQPTNEDPRSLLFNSGGAPATASTSGGGSVRPPLPRFPPQIINRFNDALSQHRQVTTVEIHHEEADDDLPPPPPPLSIQNESNFATERQQLPPSQDIPEQQAHQQRRGFPLQQEEVRQQPGVSAFMSTTSLYDDDTNRGEWGEGRSLLHRGNSMGRLPPRRPPPPNHIPTLNQQARQMGMSTGSFIKRPSTSAMGQQTRQTPVEMTTFGGGASTSTTTTNRVHMPFGRGAKPPPPDFASQSYV